MFVLVFCFEGFFYSYNYLSIFCFPVLSKRKSFHILLAEKNDCKHEQDSQENTKGLLKKKIKLCMEGGGFKRQVLSHADI